MDTDRPAVSSKPGRAAPPRRRWNPSAAAAWALGGLGAFIVSTVPARPSAATFVLGGVASLGAALVGALSFSRIQTGANRIAGRLQALLGLLLGIAGLALLLYGLGSLALTHIEAVLGGPQPGGGM